MDYFGNLEWCLTKHNLLHKPHLVLNVDEKGITCEHKPPSIIAKADHCPLAVTSGKGKTVTFIGCGSAAGQAPPPYFVCPGKRLMPELVGCSPGKAAIMTETGWSN
ncbi:hypothetical protein DPMN_078322 [Dreissena polymorpha]|uniref:DDE-1 domain-containing protein n=1 Tax=Dreissena polymorpha TaxID=45954 RepID=A0A9D4BHE0_DREPO|nr:hypothetical protein DPMN_078322 [Dreissena polymorpha]